VQSEAGAFTTATIEDTNMANFAPSAIRTGLAGPVFPVLTPFKESGEVDHAALARYVDFLVGTGARTIMTTVGTSRFNLMSEAEMMAVNETVAKASSASTITIAAGPLTGDVATNIAFATHAERIGADAYIAFFPERWYGAEAITDFFSRIAASVSIAVMIHEMPMRSGYGGQAQYPIDLLERLVSVPNIVGMKEECMDAGYTYKVLRRLANKCAIIGAGAMRNFLRDHHAGAKANLVGVGSFFPKVEIAFQYALKAGDVHRAESLVRRYEDPYFDVAVELGWHPQLKEMLHLKGLMPPFERAPMPRLTAAQQERLRDCVARLGWLDLAPDHVPE
jgi:4-hydroxy-tetrahydrodipicolinate synthase